MYKIGDKVKLIRFSPGDNITSRNFVIGQTLRVNSIDESMNRIHTSLLTPYGIDWYIPFECIRLLKDKPLTEIECLDSFKENFKDGG